MYLFSLLGYAETASFRVPESHTFHQTLPLPPRVTVVGLLGAAMGLDFMTALHRVEQMGVKIGVSGKAAGFMRDFWQFDKIKVKNRDIIKDKDVLTREYHVAMSVMLLLACREKPQLEVIRDALTSPVFALSLGNSDDLLKVHKLTPIGAQDPTPWDRFADVWLPGDLMAMCRSDLKLDTLGGGELVVAPRVFLLPDSFVAENGKRVVAKRRHYTHVGSPVKLDTSVMAFHLEKAVVPLLEWSDDDVPCET